MEKVILDGSAFAFLEKLTRATDKADVESESVRNSLDWNLLEHLATDEDELKSSVLNE